MRQVSIQFTGSTKDHDGEAPEARHLTRTPLILILLLQCCCCCGGGEHASLATQADPYADCGPVGRGGPPERQQSI